MIIMNLKSFEKSVILNQIRKEYRIKKEESGTDEELKGVIEDFTQLVYNVKRMDKEPLDFVAESIYYLQDYQWEKALDIGAGSLVECKYLIKSGFDHVTAVDRVMHDSFLKNIDSRRFSFFQGSVEEFSFPNDEFNFVSAMFITHYFSKSYVVKFIEDVKSSMKEEGIFVGTFLGPNDFRSGSEGISTFARAEVEKLFQEFSIILLWEEEGESLVMKKGEDATDLVHVFRIVARKI